MSMTHVRPELRQIETQRAHHLEELVLVAHETVESFPLPALCVVRDHETDFERVVSEADTEMTVLVKRFTIHEIDIGDFIGEGRNDMVAVLQPDSQSLMMKIPDPWLGGGHQ